MCLSRRRGRPWRLTGGQSKKDWRMNPALPSHREEADLPESACPAPPVTGTSRRVPGPPRYSISHDQTRGAFGMRSNSCPRIARSRRSRTVSVFPIIHGLQFAPQPSMRRARATARPVIVFGETTLRPRGGPASPHRSESRNIGDEPKGGAADGGNQTIGSLAGRRVPRMGWMPGMQA